HPLHLLSFPTRRSSDLDLVLTCTGSLSRNRTVGVELGKGQKLADIVGSMRMVAEGVKTTYAAVALARRHGVEMPITEQVHRLLRSEEHTSELQSPCNLV